MMRHELSHRLHVDILRTVEYLERLQRVAEALKQARAEEELESWAVVTATREPARSAAMARYRAAHERLRQAKADFLSVARDAPSP